MLRDLKQWQHRGLIMQYVFSRDFIIQADTIEQAREELLALFGEIFESKDVGFMDLIEEAEDDEELGG